MNCFGLERDAVVTVLTHSMGLYGSRLRELTAERGEYKARRDAGDPIHGIVWHTWYYRQRLKPY